MRRLSPESFFLIFAQFFERFKTGRVLCNQSSFLYIVQSVHEVFLFRKFLYITHQLRFAEAGKGIPKFSSSILLNGFYNCDSLRTRSSS